MPYKRKLKLEAALKSVIFGGIAGMTIGAATRILTRVVYLESNYLIVFSAAGAGTLVSMLLLYFLKFRPDTKETARRIDSTGLLERTVTMLELSDETSYIAGIQREDTIKRLNGISPAHLKYILSIKHILVGIFVMVSVIGISFLPIENLHVQAQDDSISQEEMSIINSLIDALRTKVDEAEVDSEIKSQLYTIIDELEREIDKYDTYIEKAAKVSEASAKIDQMLDKVMTMNDIGGALALYESTNELGTAISSAKTDSVSTALENMRSMLTALSASNLSEKLNLISDCIEKALGIVADNGIDTRDELYQAVEAFGKSLGNIGEHSASGNTVAAEINTAIEEAKTAINAAIDKQNKVSDVATEMQDLMKEAKENLFSAKNSESETEDSSQSSSQSSSENESKSEAASKSEQASKSESASKSEQASGAGEKPSGSSAGGEAQSGTAQTETVATEKIYDTTDGQVPYDEVYGSYYTDALKDLYGSEIPDDIQKLIEDYYMSLD